MIEIEKTITINGSDVELLKTTLELAQRYITENTGRMGIERSCDEYTQKEIQEVELFMRRIWDG